MERSINRQKAHKDRMLPRYVSEVNRDIIFRQNKVNYATKYQACIANAMFEPKEAKALVNRTLVMNGNLRLNSELPYLHLPYKREDSSWQEVAEFSYPHSPDYYTRIVDWSEHDDVAMFSNGCLYVIHGLTPDNAREFDFEEENCHPDVTTFTIPSTAWKQADTKVAWTKWCGFDLVSKIGRHIYWTEMDYFHSSPIIEFDDDAKSAVSRNNKQNEIIFSVRNALYLHDLRSKPKNIRRQCSDEEGIVVSIDWNLHTNLLACGYSLGPVGIWDTRNLKSKVGVTVALSNRPDKSSGEYHDSSSKVVWSKDEDRVLYSGTGVDDRKLWIWDVGTSSVRASEVVDMEAQVTDLMQSNSDPDCWFVGIGHGSRSTGYIKPNLYRYHRKKRIVSTVGDYSERPLELHQNKRGDLLMVTDQSEHFRFYKKNKRARIL